jgi:sigma-E factor negative regulatory protein RseB
MKTRALWIAFSWCLIAIPAVGTANEEVFDWLERMGAAMDQMDYQGTFVYVHKDEVESMRITHTVDERGIHERLVSVSGTQREVVRDAKGVRWFSGEDHKILADSAVDRTFFPELPVGDRMQAAESYQFRLANKQRIAGHTAQRVDIVPKDQYRYGYSLWLEEQSSLLLQWELTGNQGETLAKLMFTELKMGSEVDKGELRSISPEDSVDSVNSGPIGAGHKASVPSSWHPATLPSGFRLTSHQQQESRDGSSFEHLVYSDGIATVSVYVATAQQEPELKLGLGQLGTTHVFSRKLDGELITVLGDVPAATVKLMAESVESSKP